MKSVVAIIKNSEGNILLGRKKINPLKYLSGQRHIPGGHVEDGESCEEALKREMKEETGLEIEIGKYICSSISLTSKSEVRWYECTAENYDAVAGSDLSSVIWVPKYAVFYVCSVQATS